MKKKRLLMSKRLTLFLLVFFLAILSRFGLIYLNIANEEQRLIYSRCNILDF